MLAQCWHGQGCPTKPVSVIGACLSADRDPPLAGNRGGSQSEHGNDIAVLWVTVPIEVRIERAGGKKVYVSARKVRWAPGSTEKAGVDAFCFCLIQKPLRLLLPTKPLYLLTNEGGAYPLRKAFRNSALRDVRHFESLLGSIRFDSSPSFQNGLPWGYSQIPSETQPFQNPNQPLRGVPMVPLDPVAVIRGKAVVIIVVSFTAYQNGGEPVIFGALGNLQPYCVYLDYRSLYHLRPSFLSG